MKPNYWKRLVRAAREAPPETWPEMPFGFTRRGWGQPPAPAGARDLAVLAEPLRWAMIGCALAMIFSLAASYSTLRQPENESLMIANAAVRAVMLP